MLNRFNIILKFRQAGITELISLYCLWLAMYHPNKKINIISIKDTVAKKVLKKIKFMYKNLPSYLQEPIINGRAGEFGSVSTIEFANGSVIESIPTSDQAGRSESLSLIVVYALISNGANVDILGHLGGGIAGGILVFILYHDSLDGAFSGTVSTLLAVILTLIICFIGVTRAGIGTKASAMQDSRIDTVKEQQIFQDESITFGQCLDNKCTDPEWTIFSSTDNKKVVEFNGKVVYNNTNSSLKIQFTYDESISYWTINYMGLNGTAMDSNGAALLLNYLCSDYLN